MRTFSGWCRMADQFFESRRVPVSRFSIVRCSGDASERGEEIKTLKFR